MFARFQRIPLRPDDAIGFISAIAVLIALCGSAWYSSESDPTTACLRLDLNEATWVDLLHVDGIGNTLAHRIIGDRKTNGDFPAIEDLTRVRGIGDKSVEKMRPFLVVHAMSRAGKEDRSQ